MEETKETISFSIHQVIGEAGFSDVCDEYDRLLAIVGNENVTEDEVIALAVVAMRNVAFKA